jgi:hypothetical protein
MATLNGVIRSYGAAVRRAEREQQRQARESARRFKEQQKLKDIADAGSAVADWKRYVETIQSVHKHCTEPVEWAKIEKLAKPSEPTRKTINEVAAQKNLDKFKPSFFDKLFRHTEKKVDLLTKKVAVAKQKDENDFEVEYKAYSDDLRDWQELQEICAGVKRKEPKFYKQAIEYFAPFSDIGELGTKVSLQFEDN